MRSDMAKVIVERPRFGWFRDVKHMGKTQVLRDDDDAPLGFRAPLREKTVKTKFLNENLAPLRRFLRAQCGRPWDDVYAEICALLRPTSTVQQHVRDHVLEDVAVRTWREGDAILVATLYGDVRPLGASRARFYVDPDDGRLRVNDTRGDWRKANRAAQAAAAAEAAKRRRIVDDRLQLHRFGDVWWAVTLAKESGGVRFAAADEADVVLRAKLDPGPRCDLYGRSGVLAVDKRILAKREKRKLGLA